MDPSDKNELSTDEASEDSQPTPKDSEAAPEARETSDAPESEESKESEESEESTASKTDDESPGYTVHEVPRHSDAATSSTSLTDYLFAAGLVIGIFVIALALFVPDDEPAEFLYESPARSMGQQADQQRSQARQARPRRPQMPPPQRRSQMPQPGQQQPGQMPQPDSQNLPMELIHREAMRQMEEMEGNPEAGDTAMPQAMPGNMPGAPE